MPSIPIDAAELFFTAEGGSREPALICIHGSGGSHTHWPAVLINWKRHAVHALDLPGHGRSGGRSRNRVSAYAEVIKEFAEKTGLKQAVLMGHSLGGAVAQRTALSSPDWLEGLILVGTGARLRVTEEILNGLSADHPATIALICELAFGPSAPQQLIAGFRSGLLQTSPGITLGDYQACNRFDVMDRIEEIRCPTLIVSGALDRLTPPKYGRFLADHIPGARHVVIADAGHMMALEQPEAFLRAVESFFSDNWP
jgi:pimeloyl-ACP methyl ester carboxylesterase